jgi:hypothetical protein
MITELGRGLDGVLNPGERAGASAGLAAISTCEVRKNRIEEDVAMYLHHTLISLHSGT